jgi:hypothetical protein
MFEIDKNSIVYEHYPKHWNVWRKKFKQAAEQVAKDFSWNLTITDNKLHRLVATFSLNEKPVVISLEQANAIRGTYFGDYH